MVRSTGGTRWDVAGQDEGGHRCSLREAWLGVTPRRSKWAELTLAWCRRSPQPEVIARRRGDLEREEEEKKEKRIGKEENSGVGPGRVD
jgi:hypothetical protein